MSASPLPPPRPRRNGLLALIALLIVGGGVAAYFIWPKPTPPPIDASAAMAANTRGVGLMEQYEYADAEKEFEEAVRLNPDWTPARINLAISLLNQHKSQEKKERAEAILNEVLAKEPDDKHAHFCLGIILQDRGNLAAAHKHFVAVNKLDPDDAPTLLRLALNDPNGSHSPEAQKHLERALKLDPYLKAALSNMLPVVYAADPERGKKLLEELKALERSEWMTLSGTIYGEMGKYGNVIGKYTGSGNQLVGPLPMFEAPSVTATLAAGARWATVADLDPLRKAARERFGSTIVLFDINRDGRPDVFIASAVVENGKVRDLLLRNDGNNAFTDVTAAAGLATPRPSLGAAAADYDNDGKPDLIVTGAGEQHLFRNKGDGSFEDVSAAVGLDQVKGVYLGAAWVDLDQDGDLDLLLCRYAESIDAAGSFATPAKPTGGLELFENVGVYPPAQNNYFGGLTTMFRRSEAFAKLLPACSPVSLVLSDLDGDQDVDLLVLADGADPLFVENDRMMRFRLAKPEWTLNKARRWNGGLVLDANHDEKSDLLLVSPEGPPVLLLSKGSREFTPGATNSAALKQSVASDIDMDGFPDAVGLTTEGKAVLLHNQGDGRLESKAAFGDLPIATGLAVADLDGDGAPDLLLLTDAGLHVRRNLGNGNAAVIVEPTGRRKFKAQGLPGPERTNADGIGSWLAAYAGSNWSSAERTTATAGLGQSLLPTSLGIGKAGRAEAVRIRWPDLVYQTELGINAGRVHALIELERKPDSCPVLMTWDGEKFAFVTDFLGGGALAELEADGTVRPPRPEESVKIEAGQLKPKDGRFLIKIAEPMDEVLYLDRVRLDVVDHPAEFAIYPDERFATANPQPTQELLAFQTRHFPILATDHRGLDVTKLLLERDRKMVEGFALRSWLGFAEDHSLTLDFGGVAPAKPGQKWHLVLAGWTEYAYPESIYAAARAGVPMNVPVLERLAVDGKTWEPLGDLGFPAGLPRVMTAPLANFSPSAKTVLRIRTNMQVYWDQIYLATADDAAPMKVTPLAPISADLANRGFMQEVFPDGRPPVAYDDAKTDAVAINKWKGNLTRLGDVTDLLKEVDDRLVICGPGDEITIGFDATKLPELPMGWQRSFVLRSTGYCKSTAPTTATGGTVGPLPFRAMPNYPNFGSVKPPLTDAAHWHTRPASGK